MKKYVLNGETITLPYKYTDEKGNIVVTSSEEYLYSIGATDYVEPEKTDEEKLQDAKTAKIAEVSAYDSSSAVNEFTVGGEPMWIELDLRVKLAHTIENEKAKGTTEFTEWHDGKPYTFATDTWESMLSDVEHYAYQCLCVTEQHKANVRALTSIADVEAYDYTIGYPSKLPFNYES